MRTLHRHTCAHTQTLGYNFSNPSVSISLSHEICRKLQTELASLFSFSFSLCASLSLSHKHTPFILYWLCVVRECIDVMIQCSEYCHSTWRVVIALKNLVNSKKSRAAAAGGAENLFDSLCSFILRMCFNVYTCITSFSHPHKFHRSYSVFFDCFQWLHLKQESCQESLII